MTSESKQKRQRRIGGQRLLQGDELVRAFRESGLTGGTLEERPDFQLRQQPHTLYNIPRTK